MAHEWLAPEALGPARERLASLDVDQGIRSMVAAAPDVTERADGARRAARVCLVTAAVAAGVAFVALLARRLAFRDEVLGFSACVSAASLLCAPAMLVAAAICARTAVRGAVAVVVEREEEWWWDGKVGVWPRHLVRLETSGGRRRRHTVERPVWEDLRVGDLVVVHTHVGKVVGLRRVDTMVPGRPARPAPPERSLTGARGGSLLPPWDPSSRSSSRR